MAIGAKVTHLRVSVIGAKLLYYTGDTAELAVTWQVPWGQQY